MCFLVMPGAYLNTVPFVKGVVSLTELAVFLGRSVLQEVLEPHRLAATMMALDQAAVASRLRALVRVYAGDVFEFHLLWPGIPHWSWVERGTRLRLGKLSLETMSLGPHVNRQGGS